VARPAGQPATDGLALRRTGLLRAVRDRVRLLPGRDRRVDGRGDPRLPGGRRRAAGRARSHGGAGSVTLCCRCGGSPHPPGRRCRRRLPFPPGGWLQKRFPSPCAVARRWSTRSREPNRLAPPWGESPGWG